MRSKEEMKKGGRKEEEGEKEKKREMIEMERKAISPYSAFVLKVLPSPCSPKLVIL